MDPALLSRALEIAGRLANDAAEVITATLGRNADEHPFDWITQTDRTLERHTRRVLIAEFGTVPVVGRTADDAQPGPGPYRWVVGGPADTRCGTANHVSGFGWCAYSLALVDAAGPVVGVIADPGRAQIHAAARGRGMRANGIAVRPAERDTAGGPVCCEVTGPAAPGLLRAAGPRARVLGSAALAITQVALGHAVAAVVDTHRESDVAAALCLAGESGAAVTDADGRPDPLPSGPFVVARPAALDAVLGWWRCALAT
ncbi:MAG: inositol monophosphatase [Pseudonocardia sp.]